MGLGRQAQGQVQSSVGQLEQNVGALENLTFGDDELAAIDEHAVDTGIDLWAQAREGAL